AAAVQVRIEVGGDLVAAVVGPIGGALAVVQGGIALRRSAHRNAREHHRKGGHRELAEDAGRCSFPGDRGLHWRLRGAVTHITARPEYRRGSSGTFVRFFTLPDYTSSLDYRCRHRGRGRLRL